MFVWSSAFIGGAAREPSLFRGDRTLHPRGTRLSPSDGGETTSLKDRLAHDAHRGANHLCFHTFCLSVSEVRSPSKSQTRPGADAFRLSECFAFVMFFSFSPEGTSPAGNAYFTLFPFLVSRGRADKHVVTPPRRRQSLPCPPRLGYRTPGRSTQAQAGRHLE